MSQTQQDGEFMGLHVSNCFSGCGLVTFTDTGSCQCEQGDSLERMHAGEAQSMAGRSL